MTRRPGERVPGPDRPRGVMPTARSVTERIVDHAFPGATALIVLDVYDWIALDGLRGGSAHVHLASTEAYLVLADHGRLQTLGTRGYAEAGLSRQGRGVEREQQPGHEQQVYRKADAHPNDVRIPVPKV